MNIDLTRLITNQIEELEIDGEICFSDNFFQDTLIRDLKDVRFLVNHDLNKIPLARSRNNNENSTMRLKPTDKGLEIEADLDCENNTEARALYSAVERGDISGMSFMFSIDGEEWENLESEHPTRHIKSIGEVIEVSAVNFPAYEDTEITARGRNSFDDAKAKALELLKAKYLYKI